MVYSMAVLVMVAWMGDIGVRCIFGTELKERSRGIRWIGTRPGRVTACWPSGVPIANYTTTSGRCARTAAGRPDGRRCVGGRDAEGSGPPGAGGLSAAADVHLVVRLVPPGDGDLRRRGAGLLEAAARRLGAALLLALHRDGRRLHGGVSLDGDRRRAAPDLSVRGVRGVRAGGEPAFLPGLPAAEPDLRGLSPAGPGGALRRPDGLPGRALGGMCWSRWLGSHGGRRAVQAALRLVRGLALGYIGAGGRDLRALHRSAWRSATARRGRGPSGTRSSGSCWPR